MIYLGPKKITSFIADVITARNKPITMPPGRPQSLRRASYIRVKLRQETHQSWVEMKRILGAKSDDAFAHHLLSQTSDKLTASRIATETNHASCSSNGVVAESLHVSETTMRWVLYYSWCSQCCVSSIKWTNLHNFLQHTMFSSSASIFSNINTYKDARCVFCVRTCNYRVALI